MARLLRMPGISADAEEVVFLEWCSSPGSTVAAGDAIATVETEKANVDIEADDAAILWRTLIGPGDAVAVGAPMAILIGVDEEVGDEKAILNSLGMSSPDSTGPEVSMSEPCVPDAAMPSETSTPGVSETSAVAGITRVFASPLARKLAREHELAIETVTGSGPGGRIVRVDIERALVNGSTATDSARAFRAADNSAHRGSQDIPHTGMRRAIARALTASKQQVPHFYLDATCRVDELVSLRTKINADGSVKLSINDFILKAVGKALIDVPEMNVVWTDECVRRFDSADVSVAIGSTSGLVTPVVRGVESLSVTEISEKVRDFAARAGDGRLKQHELEGGSFSVSNLGMYGVESFSAILNPPQAGILAIGVVAQAPVVEDGEVTIGHVCKVTLSVDHRPVDGVIAATWLGRFQSLIENPALMLV